jgi:hypothetical protein
MFHEWAGLSVSVLALMKYEIVVGAVSNHE